VMPTRVGHSVFSSAVLLFYVCWQVDVACAHHQASAPLGWGPPLWFRFRVDHPSSPSRKPYISDCHAHGVLAEAERTLYIGVVFGLFGVHKTLKLVGFLTRVINIMISQPPFCGYGNIIEACVAAPLILLGDCVVSTWHYAFELEPPPPEHPKCDEANAAEALAAPPSVHQAASASVAMCGARRPDGKGGRGGLGDRGGQGGRLAVQKETLPPPPTQLVLPLSDVGDITRRNDAPESTIGGQTTCVVCMDGPKSHLAVPCGHQSVCGHCAAQISACPYCREHVVTWVQLNSLARVV